MLDCQLKTPHPGENNGGGERAMHINREGILPQSPRHYELCCGELAKVQQSKLILLIIIIMPAASADFLSRPFNTINCHVPPASVDYEKPVDRSSISLQSPAATALTFSE